MPSSKQIFLWHGSNDYTIQKKLAQWIGLFQKKYTSLNIVKLDFLDYEKNIDSLVAELKEVFQINSLFGSNKLIILKNFCGTIEEKKADNKTVNKKKEVREVREKNAEISEILISFLEKLPAMFFVIFWQSGRVDSRLRLYKKFVELQKTGKVEIEEFDLPQPFQIPVIIKKEVEARGASITTQAADRLAILVGVDLWQLENEIDKLIHYKKGKKIEIGDVDLLVKGKYNDDIFQFSDALARQDKKKALTLISDQLNSGANEFYLFTMLVRQFRLLRQVKIFVDEEHITDPSAIAKELKIHPFVAQKTLEQCRSFDLERLKFIIDKLLNFEYLLKTGYAPFRVLFDKFISEL